MTKQIPSKEEWLKTDFAQLVIDDIYDTLVKGCELSNYDFYAYETLREGRSHHYRCKAVTRLLRAHQYMGEAVDSEEAPNGNLPTNKKHDALALARLFISRGMQIMEDRGDDMRMLEENIDGGS